jgi:hypothetical protein
MHDVELGVWALGKCVVGLLYCNVEDQGGSIVSQRPIAVGLLLCEQLIIEEGTKNVTPVNCFTRRKADTFPWTSPPFTVVAWLTNGDGEVNLQVAVERVNSLEELLRRDLRANFPSPLEQRRLTLRLNSLIFPAAGAYRVLLLADGELIAQNKLLIVQKETSHE